MTVFTKYRTILIGEFLRTFIVLAIQDIYAEVKQN